MRIWTLHPKYLDRCGLVALWREALLAQAVLQGRTRGYFHHPQLIRFRERASPVGTIAEYLRVVHDEAANRGYCFVRGKISRSRTPDSLVVSRGQLDYEWQHLLEKLRRRDPARRAELARISEPRPHPLFRVVEGGIAAWEKSARPKRTMR
jgi:hypothetical protein